MHVIIHYMTNYDNYNMFFINLKKEDLNQEALNYHILSWVFSVTLSLIQMFQFAPDHSN